MIEVKANNDGLVNTCVFIFFINYLLKFELFNALKKETKF